MANNSGNNVALKKYGRPKSSTSSFTSTLSFPSSDLFSNSSANSCPSLRHSDENIINSTHIASNDAISRLSKSLNEDFLSKRKINDDKSFVGGSQRSNKLRRDSPKMRKKREVSLVELIDQGAQEDVDLLFNCLENKGIMSSFQVVLPERYSSEQRTRCHGWLLNQLEFEEECKGNIVVYKHKTRKANEFAAALKQSSKCSSLGARVSQQSGFHAALGISSSNSFHSNSSSEHLKIFASSSDQIERSRSSSAPQSNRSLSTSTASIVVSSDVIRESKFHTLRPTLQTNLYDDDDVSDSLRESPALFPPASSYSPFSDPRGAPPLLSPLEGLDHILEKGLQLNESGSRHRRVFSDDMNTGLSVGKGRVLADACFPPAEEERPEKLVHFTSTTGDSCMLVLPVPSIDAVTNFLDDQQRRAAMMTDCAPADDCSSDASTVIDESFQEWLDEPFSTEGGRPHDGPVANDRLPNPDDPHGDVPPFHHHRDVPPFHPWSKAISNEVYFTSLAAPNVKFVGTSSDNIHLPPKSPQTERSVAHRSGTSPGIFNNYFVSSKGHLVRCKTEPMLNAHNLEESPSNEEQSLYPQPLFSTSKTLVHFLTPIACKPLMDCCAVYPWELSACVTESLIAELRSRFGTLSAQREVPRLRRSLSDPYTAFHAAPLNPTSGEFSISHSLDSISYRHFEGVRSRQQNMFGQTMKGFPVGPSMGGSTPRDELSPASIFKAGTTRRLSQSTGSLLGSIYVDPSPMLSPNKRKSPTECPQGIAEVPAFNHSRIQTSGDFRPVSVHVGFSNTDTSRQLSLRSKSKAKSRRMSSCFRSLASTVEESDSTVAADRSLPESSFLDPIAEHYYSDKKVIVDLSFGSFSPEPIAKYPKSKVDRRKSSGLAAANNNSSDRNDSQVHSHSGNDLDVSFGMHGNNDYSVLETSCDTNDVRKNMLSSPELADVGFNESNFKGVVIGGVYQHCFDGAFPLVAAATASDKRVVHVAVQDCGSLSLSLYLPKDKLVKQIDLGPDWRWIRCCPTGYLAFRESSQRSMQVYYFLPKHPNDWRDDSLMDAVSSSDYVDRRRRALSQQVKRNSIIPQHELRSFGGDHHLKIVDDNPSLDIEMDCQPLGASSPDHLLDNSIKSIDCDDDIHGNNFLSTHSAEDFNFSMNQTMSPMSSTCDPAADVSCVGLPDHSLLDVVSNSNSEHFCNSSLIALVLDYLIDDSSLIGSIAMIQQSAPLNEGGCRTKTRRMGAKRLESPNIEVTLKSANELLSYQTVNKAWCLAAYMVIAKRRSGLKASGPTMTTSDRYMSFVRKFSDGKFLSEGACKRVYCVRHPSNDSLEAVSVMDIDDLVSRDMSDSITQELQISLLCSSLVTLNICPNLVRVYSLFQSPFDAPKASWRARSLEELRTGRFLKAPAPSLRDKNRGRYQFIRMEFCSGGDMEELVRRACTLQIDTLRSFLFQMCFSLYACRDKLSLRHFDVKLLNFFVTDGRSLAKCGEQGCASSFMLRIGFGANIYKLPLQFSTPSLIKLADFGTSCVGATGLSDNITVQQFTTLENAPPEFYLLGSAARQSYSADTFSLGLCFLHLLTGHEPYEELLKDVHCPAYLAERLRKIWLVADPLSPYFVLNEVVQSLDDDCYDSQSTTGPESVLLDTLYRYFVLCGASDELRIQECCSPTVQSLYRQCIVWNTVLDAVDLRHAAVVLTSNTGGALSKIDLKGKRKHQEHSKCVEQYQRDLGLWSIHCGTHPIMKRLRQCLQTLSPEAGLLLDSMLSFDPSRRCTMYDALLHPMFDSLKDLDGHAEGGGSTTDYTHYYRPTKGVVHSQGYSLSIV